MASSSINGVTAHVAREAKANGVSNGVGAHAPTPTPAPAKAAATANKSPAGKEASNPAKEVKAAVAAAEIDMSQIPTSSQHETAFEVKAGNVQYDDECITADYEYQSTRINRVANRMIAEPTTQRYQFRTQRRVPRVGLMMVGWGGNNGSTLTAGILANRHNITWNTRNGEQRPDYTGSLTQSGTMRVGQTADGEQVFVPLNSVLPMLNPNSLVVGGWDISNYNLADAMRRAEVLEYDLQRQLYDRMRPLVPLPSIYYPDFIAANQEDRANHLIPGTNKQAHLEHIRRDIRTFKARNRLDKVIVLWTANTERFSEVKEGLNDTAENLLKSIRMSEDEVSPSTIFAVASILEGCSYINGSPQNTFVPGVVELANRLGVFIGGDDFKTGQTKIKSVLMDFLVGAGLKVTSIVSYNHLGNNDGRNLSSHLQFRSKEISKRGVVEDVVESNSILYRAGDHPDHCVVIKYVPYVRDSKRALDEYISRIFLGGHNTITLNNVCEDSLLAAPLMLDLVILIELMERITWKTPSMPRFERFDPVASLLSYLLKAPMVPENAPVINSLFRQRAALTNVMRACVGLPPENDMLLEYKCQLPKPARMTQAIADMEPCLDFQPSSTLPLIPGATKSNAEMAAVAASHAATSKKTENKSAPGTTASPSPGVSPASSTTSSPSTTPAITGASTSSSPAGACGNCHCSAVASH